MMEHKDNKNNLFLLTIVAIVAIVAIVIMIASTGSRSYTLNDDTAGQAVVSSSTRATTTSASAGRAIKPSTTAICSDSDGGSIYDVRGTTTVSYRAARDYCRAYSSSTLVEYYCNLDKLSYKDYKCPNGCKDGACIKLAYCGNNAIDQSEQCDGTNLGGASCVSLGNDYIGGTLTCMPPRSQSECSFNIGDCKALKVQLLSTNTLSTALNAITYTQGDNVYIIWTANQNMANYLRYIGLTSADDASIQLNIETNEELIGLSGKYSWEIPSYLPVGRYYVEVGAQPRGPGSMYAKSQVFTVVAREPYCGDGILDPTFKEECDGDNWGAIKDCTNFGFLGGTLACGADCQFDTSHCSAISGTARCGNGKIDAGEDCDPAAGLKLTCADFGFQGGTLSCMPPGSQNECSFNTAKCTVISAETAE